VEEVAKARETIGVEKTTLKKEVELGWAVFEWND
jgi:hypothetical protein